MDPVENKQVVLRCIEMFNQCTLEWLNTFYSNKLEWIELPKQGTPPGRQGGFAVYYKSAEQLLHLFPDRKITVLRCVAESDTVVLEQLWQGTAAVTIGNYVQGNIARLRVASFFTLENGLIIKQIDYCVSAM
jgi:hypothetical protein